jgi:hypothetical protein
MDAVASLLRPNSSIESPPIEAIKQANKIANEVADEAVAGGACGLG